MVLISRGPNMGVSAAARWPKSDLALKCVARESGAMRLNQITAPARDLGQSIAFYEMLGLRLIVRGPHYARFELLEGEATFSLHLVDGPIARENAPKIYFECDDLALEVRRLREAGVAFEHDLIEQSWLWTEAWLRDPAGNSVCLYHAGENRRHPPWRIG